MRKKKIPLISRMFMFLLIILLSSCEERSFPVSPIDDPYPYIPPSDVGMLTTESGDGSIKLIWSDPPEDNVSHIEITNLNDNTSKVVSKGDKAVEFTGLENFEKYSFEVKAKNSENLYSVGVVISAYPFRQDNVAPGNVKDIISFKGTTIKDAILTFTLSGDVDYSHAVAYINGSDEGVASALRGKVIRLRTEDEAGIKSVLIKSFDFSGNQSAGITVLPSDIPLANVAGGDEETSVRVKWTLHPGVDFVEGYRIAWGDNFANTRILEKTATDYSFPLDELQSNIQVNVSILDENNAVLSTYPLIIDGKSIPGTVRADAAIAYNGLQIRGDGGFGNVDNNSWAEYELNVKEDGEYRFSPYTGGPSATKVTIYIDGTETAVVNTTPSGNWDGFIKQTPSASFHLTAGKHRVKMVFGDGQNILKYYFSQE